MIVAFTKDWDDVPTCTTHILREMAKTVPVLWVSSIGTRKPSASSVKDVRRVIGRVFSGLKAAELKENKLRVLKPILIPKAEAKWAKWVNRKIFAWYVRREMRGVGKKVRSGECEVGKVVQKTDILSSRISAHGSLEYWCFVPNAVDLLPADAVSTRDASHVSRSTSDAPRVIYYCADDWTQFHNLDGDWMGGKERELVKRANVIFATSRFLEKKLGRVEEQGGCPDLSTINHQPSTSKTHYMPHGVEYSRFAQALNKELPLPDDVAGLPRPVIGFYGNLHPWIDFNLVAALAKSRPEWSFVMIGEKYSEVDDLEELPNVFLLGRREHSLLHEYCRAFDVAIIPYDMSNPRMESVNPVKTKELLAAGLPVVASEVPELRNYGDDVLVCTGVEAWLSALDSQVARKDQQDISDRVSDESWVNKVSKIREIIDAV